jgi:D-sedoheptulose 7-phosphate isomerase
VDTGEVTTLYEQVDEHTALAARVRDLVPEVQETGVELCRRLDAGGVLYACGNGGSAADAQHLVAELVGRYLRERRPLGAVALTTDPSVLTCIANDYDYDEVFARQVAALAGERDVVVGFTTSGASRTVLRALEEARRNGAYTVVFTGLGGAALSKDLDRAFVVPSTVTARVQEMHVMLLHLLSEVVDRRAAARTGGVVRCGLDGSGTDTPAA